MVTSVTSTIPVIPGISGLGNISAIAAYKSISKKGQVEELAMVAKAPQVAKERQYFENAVQRMVEVDDLLKDRRALNYLLTSYGLGSEVNKTGIIQKVLTQDPSAIGSLVNSLADSRWRVMARDLDLYNSGIGKLKGDITSETFKTTTIGNRYLSALKLDSLGNVASTFYSNSFDLSVLSSGKLATSEGYVMAGYKLDNLGNIIPGEADKATNSVTVRTAELDDKGINKTKSLDQSLTRISGDTWQWTVKKNGTTMVSQQVEIKFAADGKMISIDGATNKSKTVTLDWGTAGITQQSFDLEQVFKDTEAREIKPVQVNWFDNKKTASKIIMPSVQLNKNQAVANPDFFSNVTTQTIKNPDKAVYSASYNDPSAQAKTVSNVLTRVSDDTWKLTVKDGTDILLEKEMDIIFDSDGNIATIDGVATDSVTETLDWGTAGTTSQAIDIGEIFEESKQTTTVALKQTFTRVSGDTWQWKIMRTGDDAPVLQDKNVNLTFKADGTVATIDGEYTSSQSVTLDYGGFVGEAEHVFELNTAFKRADFTQTVRVTDNAGTDRTVRVDYIRTDSVENRWQAKIWYDDYGTLADTVDFKFNSEGKVAEIGDYNSSTGTIQSKGYNPDKTFEFYVDWQRGLGGSTLKLDFSSTFSHGGKNIEVHKMITDSIALGKRSGVDIDENGNVIANYQKLDGTGNVQIKLYRLMASNFASPGSLKKDEETGYFSATATSGDAAIRPLGTDKDLLGNLIDGYAGKLAEPAKTTDSKTVLEVLADGYNQNVYEQALGKENVALRYAVYFKNNASKFTNIYSLLGDRAMRDVVATVFGIPERVATQSVETQANVFSRKFDIEKLQDPKFVDQFIQRFLVMSGDSGGTQASGWQNSLMGGGNAGSVLNLVAQNINVLA